MEIVIEVLKVLAALLVLGLSTERGTQLLKEIWNLIVTKFPFLSLHDKKSFFLSAVVAFVVAYYFNVDITQYLSVLDGFDPDMLELVNALLLMLFANKSHDKLFGGASG